MSSVSELLAASVLSNWLAESNADAVLDAVQMRSAPVEVLDVVCAHFPAWDSHYSENTGKSCTGFFESIVDAVSRNPNVTTNHIESLVEALDPASYPMPLSELESLGLISGEYKDKLLVFLTAKLAALHDQSQARFSGEVAVSLPELSPVVAPVKRKPRKPAPDIPTGTRMRQSF